MYFFPEYQLERFFLEQELHLRQEYFFHEPELQRLREGVSASTLSFTEGYNLIRRLLGEGFQLDFIVDALLYGELEARRLLLLRTQAFLEGFDE